jgi:hypothetical protein
MNNPRPDLDALLSTLPREVPVSRDLWPDIAGGIERRSRRLVPLALAASVLAVCASGALFWVAGRGWLPAHTTAAASRPATGREPSFDEPHNPAFLAARAALEAAYRERLATVDPATRAKIEASLSLIRSAHEQLRLALAAQPADPVLENLFETTLDDEFDLYDSVVRGTQPSIIRS